MMVIAFRPSPSGWSVGLTYLVLSSVRIKELGKDELQLWAKHLLCAWADPGARWEAWCIRGAAITPKPSVLTRGQYGLP